MQIRIVHYFIMFGILFLLPFFIGIFSYYKIFFKTHQHQQNVALSLQNTSNNGTERSSVREVNISRVLFYVAAGSLFCWIPMWPLILWKRFSPETCPRIAELLVTFFRFLSASINPLIYTFTNGDFRREFRKLLLSWKGARSGREESTAVVGNEVGERGDDTNV